MNATRWSGLIELYPCIRPLGPPLLEGEELATAPRVTVLHGFVTLVGLAGGDLWPLAWHCHVNREFADQRTMAITVPVTVRSAGAVPSTIAAMMRGETKARVASWRTYRSPWASRFAISAKEAVRPSRMSSIHPRALTIAVSRTSRLSAFSSGFAEGVETNDELQFLENELCDEADQPRECNAGACSFRWTGARP